MNCLVIIGKVRKVFYDLLLCIVDKLNRKSDKILKAMGINLFAQVISYYGNLTLIIGSIVVNFIPIAVLLLLINEKK